jgi:hypothetical protein
MDMKKILKALDNPSPVKVSGKDDMKRFLNIVESKTNRLTQAESIIMQEQSKPITQQMLNKQPDAKPSMIGKYFRSVETELAESQSRKTEQAKKLAKKVTERVSIGPDGQVTGGFKPTPSEPPQGGNVIPKASVILGGKEYAVVLQGDIRGRYSPGPGVPRVTAQGYIENGVITLTIDPPKMEEGVAGPKNCWPGHRKVGTKPGTGKNAGKRVNDCEKIKGK